MYNAFKERLRPQKSAESLIKKERLKQKFRKRKMLEMAERSDQRVGQWMAKVTKGAEDEDTQRDTSKMAFFTNYHNGAIPLVPEIHHQFKEYENGTQFARKESGKRKYVPENIILKKNLYEYIDRTKNWLRKRRNNLEIQKPMKFGGSKTDNDRMDWHFKMMSPTDSVIVPTEQKFYIDPKWKVTTPNKWMSNQDFKTGRSLGWSIKTNSNKQMYDPYIDGFEVTGDTLVKRTKQKEVSTAPFVSTIQP